MRTAHRNKCVELWNDDVIHSSCYPHPRLILVHDSSQDFPVHLTICMGHLWAMLEGSDGMLITAAFEQALFAFFLWKCSLVLFFKKFFILFVYTVYLP